MPDQYPITITVRQLELTLTALRCRAVSVSKDGHPSAEAEVDELLNLYYRLLEAEVVGTIVVAEDQ